MLKFLKKKHKNKLQMVTNGNNGIKKGEIVMKKNKGFTLVELLAVIVILALLVAIAVPGVIAISSRVKEKMYCSKISDIEAAARLYAEDNEPNSPVKVIDLVISGYYKKEDKNCINNNKPCVTNPINGDSIDDEEITINKQNTRYKAKYNNKPDSCN